MSGNTKGNGLSSLSKLFYPRFVWFITILLIIISMLVEQHFWSWYYYFIKVIFELRANKFSCVYLKFLASSVNNLFSFFFQAILLHLSGAIGLAFFLLQYQCALRIWPIFALCSCVPLIVEYTAAIYKIVRRRL